MQTRSSKIVEEREQELENIIGNLLIAEYQVQRLRSKLTEKIRDVHSASPKNKSAYTFKHDGKWYRLSVSVDEMDTTEKVSDSG